jgi:hypothetical protein
MPDATRPSNIALDSCPIIMPSLLPDAKLRFAKRTKNALFVGTERGGHTAAVISSLSSTCQRYGINPQAYLTQLLTNLLDTTCSRIDEWLPNEWKKRNSPPPSSSPASHPSSQAPR